MIEAQNKAQAAQAQQQLDQARMQAEQQTAQGRLQFDGAKLQAEQQSRDADRQVKMQADQLAHQREIAAQQAADERERAKIQAEIALKSAELKLKQDELASKQLIEQAKLHQTGELAILELQAKYQTTIDAAQIKAASDALRAKSDIAIQSMESADTRLQVASDHVRDAQEREHAEQMAAHAASAATVKDGDDDGE
jgi:hypothetical protein